MFLKYIGWKIQQNYRIYFFFLIEIKFEKIRISSLLAHSSNIDNLLEGLDGVLKDWLNGLHDTKSSLHIIDLWLHSFDGLHLSSDFNERLSIIESLEDSSGKGLLDAHVLCVDT